MLNFITGTIEIVVGVVVADLLVKHAPTINESAKTKVQSWTEKLTAYNARKAAAR